MQSHTETPQGRIVAINGPILRVKGLQSAKVRDMVSIGNLKLFGEIIRLKEDFVTVQSYEETPGIRLGEGVTSYNRPLSMELGPGLLNQIFDGIQRPLKTISDLEGAFIARGVNVPALDRQKKWEFKPLVKESDTIRGGDPIGYTQETSLIKHWILTPPNVQGRVQSIKASGEYPVEEEIAIIKNNGNSIPLKMYHYWSIRQSRPYANRTLPSEPLLTGMRVLDLLFPIAKGGTVAIPGGFGTGKTVVQQNIAKWCDADIIVYIGCGERGNEMAEVLEDFPKLQDPKSGKPLMERTILIGNTSNMPVAAREASIFTGLTMGEYYRDMGYNVAVLADSTSRWAEALREISGRLEEMPAEGGYPAYLASRLSAYYERAGAIQTIGSKTRDASLTLIGAISPPSGDFSEPVTKTTKRFVRAFWALDAKLAYSRHYPAISWIDSYSNYDTYIVDWWNQNVEEGWSNSRQRINQILALNDNLQNIVQLIGSENLPVEQQLAIFVADIIKRSFLIQNAYDEVDRFCSPRKLLKMTSIILRFYDMGIEAIKAGVPLFKIKEIKEIPQINRIRIDVKNSEMEKIDTLLSDLKKDYQDLIVKFGANGGLEV